MVIFRILAGVVVLTLGRKLFWLFVGVVGFIFGISLATQFFRGQPDWVILVIALAAGLLGVVFALLLQRVAVFLAGFIAGGYITLELLSVVGWQTGRFTWLAVLMGGIIGGLLVAALFDWALIVLSSLTGATIILQAAHFGPRIAALLFIALFAVGLVVQASLMGREQPPSAPPAKM